MTETDRRRGCRPAGAAVLLALLALGGCGSDGAAERTRVGEGDAPGEGAGRVAHVPEFAVEAPDVVLLITGGNHGRLEVCDCPGPMAGGLMRRGGLVRSYRRAFPRTLLIDTGDLFWVDADSPVNPFVLRGYRLIGYDAVVLGDLEWNALADGLPGMLRSAGGTYLSTNASAEGKSLPVTREVTGRFGDGKLAILSYLGPGTLILIDGESGRRMETRPLPAVLARARKLKADGHAVVLVAHVSEMEAAGLEDLGGVDLVVRGNVTRASGAVDGVAGVPAVKVGGPDHVGALALDLDGGRIADLDWRLEVVTDRWPADQRLYDLFREYRRERLQERATGQ
jgi:2',3'-cyclic-nucleotide 2'-phosphodiesterase (5'-nucleotidase family)